MKKVLFIAYYFPPIGGGGVQRSVKFVKYLPDLGYLPVVLTCTRPVAEKWTPKDSSLENNIGDNHIIYRVSIPPPVLESEITHRLKKIFFIKDNFSKWWIKYAKDLGEKIIKDNKIDVIYASMSPFQSSYVANYLSIKYNIPWVADLRDAWALDEMVVYPSAMHRMYNLYCMKDALYGASAIIMNTKEAAVSLKNKFRKYDTKNIFTITNGYDANDFNQIVSNEDNNKFRIVHSGTLFTESGMKLERNKLIYNILGGVNKKVNILGRSLVYLLKAIEDWIDESPDIMEKIEVILIGKSTPDDIAMLEGSRCKNIFIFTGYIKYEESLNYLKSASALFLPMHGTTGGLRATSVPGKLYEYMASGRPILAAVPEGDAKDMLLNSGLAYISPPDDAKSLLKGLKSMYNNWNNKTNIYHPNIDYISSYQRKNLTKSLVDVYDSIAK